MDRLVFSEVTGIFFVLYNPCRFYTFYFFWEGGIGEKMKIFGRTVTFLVALMDFVIILFFLTRNMSYPSVWLTSYCARVFQEANFYEWENFIFIDPQVN